MDSITSNAGHLLWSGIVDEDKAPDVVASLLDERMFSGWDVRTMAEGEGGYNPIEYHNGTVWPHDNAFIAAGLRRYGNRQEAARIAFAILEAATYFDWRLPEVFAGYPRELTHFPVEYPTASAHKHRPPERHCSCSASCSASSRPAASCTPTRSCRRH